MENPLDGAAPSPSTLHTPGLLNMNHFTLDLDLSPAPDSHLLVPQSSAAKQPKKRKSWGQALPEPKTSLPPRKRAKTDDEKEQRRIERIKRNRAAAHNSRERKRVEAERLEVENIRLKHQLASMQQHLLRQHAQLTEFQRLVPNALPQLSSEDFASMTFDLSEIKEESSSNAGTPASSVDTSVDTIDPRASFSESTPLEDMSTPFIKAESPAMSMTMPTPSVAPATGASLDQTQHSAVSVEQGLPHAGERMVGASHPAPDAHEHHGVLQDTPGGILDSMAGAHNTDYGYDAPLDNFFENLFEPDIFSNSNNTNDTSITTTANRPFSDLDNTFLSPELPLSAPPIADFSAIFSCEGSAAGGC